MPLEQLFHIQKKEEKKTNIISYTIWLPWKQAKMTKKVQNFSY